MMLFWGQTSWTKCMLFGDRLTALACHWTKNVNKAEELTYISIKIGRYSEGEGSIQSPCTNKFITAAFDIESMIYFF